MRLDYITAALRLFLVSLPTWLLEGAIELALYIIGLFVVLLAARCTVIEPSALWPDRKVLAFRWRWLFLWGNAEDGIDGLRGGDAAQVWWARRTKAYSDVHRIFAWAALRNPTGNLRFISPFGFHIDPTKIRYVGNSRDPDADYAAKPGTYGYFAWQGIYSGFWVIYRGWQFRAGWKLLPRDQAGLAPDDYRRKGCGTALQFQRK